MAGLRPGLRLLHWRSPWGIMNLYKPHEKGPSISVTEEKQRVADEHFGYCNRCQALVPVRYEVRPDRVLLVKDCADCGRTETVVSTDPGVWQRKRELDRLSDDSGCRLNCRSCRVSHKPTTVFLEVTNRCNQNCPICIANIPHMGFKFEPPFDYFERVFHHLAALDPKPSVKLFGGEPTVRDDLVEIVRCARGLGLSTSIVTNGLRLADEAYAREILATRAKLIFAFDGRDPAVYEKLRGDSRCYEKKLRALDNIRKHRKAKIIIMCVVARGINDHLIGDLFEFCHERSDFINGLEFIPLTRTWEPGSIAADGADITAMEDVEKIVAAGVPGGKLDFLPAGLVPFRNIGRYLPMPRLTFAGAHPNCESISFVVSDGTLYRPAADYLRGKSLSDFADELAERDRCLGERMERLRRGIIGRIGLERLAGRLLALKTIGGLLRKNVDTTAIFGKHPRLKIAKVGLGIVLGRKTKDVLRANTKLRTVLRVVVLPFEEPRTLDSAKLRRCPAAFAYVDADTDEVRTIPVCAWGLYRDDAMRKIMTKYGSPTGSDANAGAPADRAARAGNPE